MSFKGATAGFHIDERKTTLHLIGGRDCVPGTPLSSYTPDLWVRGGSAIEKSLCVLGNIYTEGFFIGNLCSELALVETFSEKFMGEGITVVGNLHMSEDSILFAPVISTMNITGNGDLLIDNAGDLILCPDGNVDFCNSDLANVNTIFGGPAGLILDPGDGKYVTIKGNGLLLDGGDICDVGTLKTMNIETEDITVGNTLTVPTIDGVQHINGNGKILVCTDGDIELKPQGGNLILHNTAMVFDISQNILSNIMCIQAGVGVPLQLKTDPGFKVVIAEGDGLDLQGRELCNVGNLTVGNVVSDHIISTGNLLLCAADTVTIKSNGKVDFSSGSGIDLQGGDVCDVGTLQTDNITSNIVNANVVCTHDLQVDSISPKTPGANITVEGNVNANLVCTYDLQVDTISAKTGANITMNGNVDIGETLFVSTISGKSPVTVTDDVNVLGALSLGAPLSETEGGTGQSSFATGDILYASGANTLSKLAAVGDGNVLTMASGMPSWSPPVPAPLPSGTERLVLFQDWQSTMELIAPTVATPGSPTGSLKWTTTLLVPPMYDPQGLFSGSFRETVNLDPNKTYHIRIQCCVGPPLVAGVVQPGSWSGRINLTGAISTGTKVDGEFVSKGTSIISTINTILFAPADNPGGYFASAPFSVQIESFYGSVTLGAMNLDSAPTFTGGFAGIAVYELTV